MRLDDVTRVTLVTKQGVAFEQYDMYDEGVYFVLQDEGRTLKIFPVDSQPHH
jgi:hypothetical protein